MKRPGNRPLPYKGGEPCHSDRSCHWTPEHYCNKDYPLPFPTIEESKISQDLLFSFLLYSSSVTSSPHSPSITFWDSYRIPFWPCLYDTLLLSTSPCLPPSFLFSPSIFVKPLWECYVSILLFLGLFLPVVYGVFYYITHRLFMYFYTSCSY